MKEVWKPIKGFEELYEISNLGRLKILSKTYYSGRDYLVKTVTEGKISNMVTPKDRYHTINLTNNCTRKTIRVHRLVAEAFIPNPENKKTVNHINGLKHDNRAVNLEWCTQKENVQHALKNGLLNIVRGEANGASKLKEQDVRDIRKLCKFLTNNELKKMFNVSESAIRGVVKKIYWKHIKEEAQDGIQY